VNEARIKQLKNNKKEHETAFKMFHEVTKKQT